MAGAKADALDTGRPQRETLDFVTEHGPAEVHFGYDPGVKKPFWIEYPGPDGTRMVERFKELGDYHEFYEARTNTEYPPPDVEPGARNTPRTDDTQHHPTQLQDGEIIWGRDRPLTLAEAEAQYETVILLDGAREVIILQNVDTHEYVLIQGGESVAAASTAEWESTPAPAAGTADAGAASATTTASARTAPRASSISCRPARAAISPRRRRTPRSTSSRRARRSTSRSRRTARTSQAGPLRVRPDQRGRAVLGPPPG